MANRSPLTMPVVRGLGMLANNGDVAVNGDPVRLQQASGVFTAIVTVLNGTDALAITFQQSLSDAGPWQPCPSTGTLNTPTNSDDAACLAVFHGRHTMPWVRPVVTSGGDGDSQTHLVIIEGSLLLQAAA